MKLILVSNRLPVSLSEQDGEPRFRPSPGGLASGLRTYLSAKRREAIGECLWVGWPGGTVRAEHRAEVVRRCRDEYGALPVFLSSEDMAAFYEGFCNKTLWPLFHYFPERVGYDEGQWESYQRVNAIFRDAVLPVVEPGDLVWVHDYHLLLLPALLRQRVPGLRIGFFLHIPFPSYELFRLLPARWRSALLEGMLGADVVGFHTYDYTQHFLKSVRRILGYEHDMGRIALRDRLVRADTFPMGIAFDFFSGRADDPEVLRQREDFQWPLGGCKAVLSIDRLDYTKGIANRLLAYEAFLEASPDWHGKVVLLMIVVPSRTGVDDYQRMKAQVDQLVGRINGRFGTLNWTPVLYQYRSYPQERLIALYGASAVMLVTPLRDGMNLIAKEYVAARADGEGVLVLSEMAGAASELGEAEVVNPNDIPGIARALRIALEMPPESQRLSMAAMRERVRRYDVIRWASDFFAALRNGHPRPRRRRLSAEARERLLADFQAARRRLLLCEYDGVLMPLRSSPDKARPDPALEATLRQLAARADVVIVSGRSRARLDAWFGPLGVNLVAEHGACVRERSREWTCLAGVSDSWKPQIRDLMERYVDLLPGAWVEDKEFTLAWHYRRADPDLAALRARELADHLIALTETADLKIVEGDRVIEVRPTIVNKATGCEPFLVQGHDFVLALGNAADEELFRVLPDRAHGVGVGNGRSPARFTVPSPAEARALLESLAASAGPD